MNMKNTFNLLESPNVPPSTKQVTYKIFVYGKEAVGKTSFITFLTEGKGPEEEYRPTEGTRITNMYQSWSECGMDPVLIRLRFWDAGYNSCQRYSHLLPDCLNETDAIIYVFSLNDKNSFHGLSEELSTILTSFEVPPIVFLIANKSDDVSHILISQNQIERLLMTSSYPLFRLSSTEGQPKESSDIIKYLCKSLWKRDQNIIQIKNKLK